MSSRICHIFNFNLKDVWNVVTDIKSCDWRSDTLYIQITEGGKGFIEYYKNGNVNIFKILEKNKYRYYKLKIINKNFKGIWEGSFYPLKNNRTQIVFSKKIYVEKSIKRFLAKHLWNIRNLQIQYIKDVERRLMEMKCHE